MERFQLDLDHLPKNKKDALRFFMNNLANTPTDKSNLVCGLIFLGFRTLKGKSFTNMPMNMPASTSDNFKIRINFSDAALSTYLSYFEAKKSKRNCVLALLYTGICSFEEYSHLIQKKAGKNSKKIVSVEQIEEDIYLSGLTHFFETYNSDYITEFSMPQKKSNKPMDESSSSANLEDADKATILPNNTDLSLLKNISINKDSPLPDHSIVLHEKTESVVKPVKEDQIFHDVKSGNKVQSDSNQVANRRQKIKVDVG